MQKEKVNIAQGYPETRERLREFLGASNLKYPETRLKTLADAIDFAIQEAAKVPALEKENTRLRKVIIELEKNKKLEGDE